MTSVQEQVRLNRLARVAAILRSEVRRADLAARSPFPTPDERLTAKDARIYRCPGCGDWRYRSDQRARPNDRITCPGCGTHRDARKAAA